MGYDPRIHHRRSIRLPGYDYSQAGVYFVTIVAQGRELLFGEVVDDAMQASDAGRMVEAVWAELAGHFPGVAVDLFVLMPNHLHGIVVLGDPASVAGADPVPPGPVPADPVGAGFPRPVAPGTVGVPGGATESHGTAATCGDAAPALDARGGGPAGGEGGGCAEVEGPGGETPGAGDTSAGSEGRGGKTPPLREGGGFVGQPTLGQVVAYLKYHSAKRINALRSTPYEPIWQRNYYEHVIRDQADWERISEYIADNPAQWALDDENPACTTAKGGA